MPEYYELLAKGQRENNYVIREYDTGRELLPYFQDACSGCRRVELFKVVHQLGVPEQQRVRVRKGTDFFDTSDGFTGVSTSLREFVETNNISGLSFIPMPNDPFYLVEPTCCFDVDFSKGEFHFGRTCDVCNRPREVAGRLRQNAIPKEINSHAFVSPIGLGRIPDYRLYIPRDLAELLKKERFKGLEFREVPE